MRLILSYLPSDFDPEQDVVAGPWCFTSCPEDFEYCSQLEYFPDTDECGLDRRLELQRCLDYCEYLLVRLIPRLNAMNGVSYSLKFWRRLMDSWLILFVQTLYFAQHTSGELRRIHGKKSLMVELLPWEAMHKFQDTHTFNGLASLQPDFYWWMISRFVEERPGHGWQISYSERPKCSETTRSYVTVPCTSDNSIKKFYCFVKKALRPIIQWLRNTIASRCVNVYGMRDWQAALFSVMLSLKRPIELCVLSECELPQMTSTLNDGPVIHCLDDVRVMEIAWQVMPASFKNLSRLPTFKWRMKRGKVRIIGPRVVIDDAMKLAIARSMEEGEIIIGSQHGSHYGNGRQMPFQYAEYTLHAFITWGWKSSESYLGRFVPLPSPLLGQKRHHMRGDDIFFVGTTVAMAKLRLDSSRGMRGIIDYVRMKKIFIDSLADGLVKHLLYRPMIRPDGIFDEIPFLRTHYPSLRIQNEWSESKLYGARLVVMDNPETTLHVVLSANIPVVCYWHPEDWEMTAEANVFYGKLHDAGILYFDPVLAARKVEEVWNDVDTWWATPEVQCARSEWCDQFARSSPRWFSKWMRTLWHFGATSNA